MEKMADASMVCNIKREGVMRRYRASTVMLIIAVLATMLLNVYYPNNWQMRLVLFPLFLGSSVTFGQAPAKTCIRNAAMGVDEDSKFKLKRIVDQKVVFSLRLRALGLTFVSATIGLVLALIAFASSRLEYECRSEPPTCSLYYV